MTIGSLTNVRILNPPTISFPIDDVHGNRMCSLSRNGSDYFTTDTVRYCANPGHVQEDESGLVYMRTRCDKVIHAKVLFGLSWSRVWHTRARRRLLPVR